MNGISGVPFLKSLGADNHESAKPFSDCAAIPIYRTISKCRPTERLARFQLLHFSEGDAQRSRAHTLQSENKNRLRSGLEGREEHTLESLSGSMHINVARSLGAILNGGAEDGNGARRWEVGYG